MADLDKVEEDPARTSNAEADGADDEEELLAMKKRVEEMEAEAAKLRELQSQLDSQADPRESKEDIDARSIFVGNVDYGASPEEIQAHFQSCGPINRVTILLDKFSGHPKGYAYVEFSEPNLVTQALVLNESVFKNRNIKVAIPLGAQRDFADRFQVVPKRTNLPGMHARGGRGGPGRGAPRGRGGFAGAPYGAPYAAPYGGGRGGYGAPGFAPRGGYRGGYRGGRGRGYNPY